MERRFNCTQSGLAQWGVSFCHWSRLDCLGSTTAPKAGPMQTHTRQNEPIGPADPAWGELTSPLAGYCRVLSVKLASVVAGNAALSQVIFSAKAPLQPACALGARYLGPVWLGQLEQWAGRTNGWWARAQACISTDDNAKSIALSGMMPARPDSADNALFERLNTRHAITLGCQSPGARLVTCALLKPLCRRGVQRQSESVRAAIPAIRCGFIQALAAAEQATSQLGYPLSPAERLIAPLLERGMSEPAIAERVGKSRHTVHTHTRSIYRKLGVRSKRELSKLSRFQGNR